jgi:uncharacterized protein YegJ (DUF2314 family)
MKVAVPAVIVIVIIITIATILGRSSCAKPDVQLVQTGVEQTTRNPEVATAVLTARHTLNQFIERFQHPKPGDSGFSIEGDFPTAKGPEHIWVHVDSYEKGVFKGRMAEDPIAIEGKHKGDTVEVKSENISDWGYKDEHGKMVGGFTIKALQQKP